MKRVALVIANPDQEAALALAFTDRHIDPVIVSDSVGAMNALGRAQFSAVLLAAPVFSGSAGADVCRVARLRHSGVPILMAGPADWADSELLKLGARICRDGTPAVLALATDEAMDEAPTWDGVTQDTEAAALAFDEKTLSDDTAPPLLQGEVTGPGSGAALLMSIWGQELTGRLEVTGGPAAGALFFLGGDPTSAVSAMGGEANVRERVIAAIHQESGHYAFYPTTDVHADSEHARVNPFGLMLEARRRRMAPAFVLDESLRIKPKYVKAALGLQRAAARILPFTRAQDLSQLITGLATVDDLLTTTGLDSLMGTLVLLTLSDAHLVSFHDMPVEPTMARAVYLKESMSGGKGSGAPMPLDLKERLAFDSDRFDEDNRAFNEQTEVRESTGSAMRYEIIDRIGCGGMAEVFLGRAIGHGFEKRVALKRILPEFAKDEKFIEMFLQEARVAARVQHPNVVQMIDLGRTRNDYYMVMEHVHGVDLQTLLQEAKDRNAQMPLEIAARIVADVCAGLTAAHEATDSVGRPTPIIHRDVSPSNVLVSVDGHVKLSDFGIAKSSDSRLQTETGAWKGKRSYLAPEYLAGGKADARSDLFAAGIVLYLCIALHHPFGRKSVAATFAAQGNADALPLADLRSDVPASLVAIVARALAKDPANRFQRARDFQLALEEFAGTSGRPAFALQVAAWATALMPPERPRAVLSPTIVVLQNLPGIPRG